MVDLAFLLSHAFLSLVISPTRDLSIGSRSINLKWPCHLKASPCGGSTQSFLLNAVHDRCHSVRKGPHKVCHREWVSLGISSVTDELHSNRVTYRTSPSTVSQKQRLDWFNSPVFSEQIHTVYYFR